MYKYLNGTEAGGTTNRHKLAARHPFPRLDPDVHKIVDDQRMCIDLLEQQHVLLTHGTGFNLPSTDHIRVVLLAPVEVLSDAHPARRVPGDVPSVGSPAGSRAPPGGTLRWMV